MAMCYNERSSLDMTTSIKIDFKFLVNYYLPRAPSIAPDQNISPVNGGIYRRPPILSPYLICSGSNIVTYPCERIRFAKKYPPVKCNRKLYNLAL